MANNYTLGRGELYFARYDANSVATGELYLGNTPEFGVTIESETLDHFSSDAGIREKDQSIVLEVNRTGNFITDHIAAENIALFFFGSSSTLTDAGATVVNEPHTVEKGKSYQLGTSSTHPAGRRDVSAINVTNEAGTTTYVSGTDFTVDATLGRITIPETGSAIAVSAAQIIHVDYTVAATSRKRVISGSQAVEGALRYVAKNPVGKQFDWYMPHVKLSPNGDYALKGEEWQQIPFNIEILKKTGYEAIYIDGRPGV